MLLLHARLVVVLLAIEVHQIQFVYQPAGLQHLQRPVNSHPVDFGILFLGKMEQIIRVKVLRRLVNQVEQNLPLPRQSHSSLLQRLLDARRHAFRIQELPRYPRKHKGFRATLYAEL